MNRTKALSDLFTSLFTDAELRVFLRSRPWGDTVGSALPGGPTSLSFLAFEAVSLLERHGRVDAELFQHLQQERPSRRAEIELVASLYLGRNPVGQRISTSRLPISGAHFVGREDVLAQLNAAWEDPTIRVVSIVALGGAGKTALVNHWLQELERDGWRGAERVFGWSFYSQGTRDSVTSAELFVHAALRWFGDPEPTAGSPRDRGLRLADLIRQQRTLLVLDGVEPLQHPPGRDGLEGRLKDTDLAVVLRELAADMLGLCIITTRIPVAELASRSRSSAPRIDLGRLSAASGAVLLRQLGVTGSDAELHEATEDMHGHALALTLLGRYLERARGGDVRCRADLPVLEQAERIGSDKAYRVMAARRTPRITCASPRARSRSRGGTSPVATPPSSCPFRSRRRRTIPTSRASSRWSPRCMAGRARAGGSAPTRALRSAGRRRRYYCAARSPAYCGLD